MAVVFAITRSDLRSIDYRRVRDALHGMDVTLLAFAGLLTVVNFAIMGIYDVICFRGSRVRARERWWIGTLAFAWSNFLTLGPLAGPAIRFWLYRPLGVSFGMLRQAIASIVFGYGGALLLWIAVVHDALAGNGMAHNRHSDRAGVSGGVFRRPGSRKSPAAGNPFLTGSAD